MPQHYKQFPPEFEPYKICNNANFNGNLQQIFQYVARRKHKGNEIGDLEKALDFVRFEEERREQFSEEEIYYEFLTDLYKNGYFIKDLELSKNFYDWCSEKDYFLAEIYNKLALCNDENLNEIENDIINEINRLKEQESTT